jgi:hypothetical protein
MRTKTICYACYGALDSADLREMRPYLPAGVKAAERGY